LVEQLFCKQQVVGSNPTGGSDMQKHKRTYSYSPTKLTILALIAIALIVGAVKVYLSLRAQKILKDSEITIILSPHYDDAVLSMGGLLAEKGSHAVVATFFNGKPALATSTIWDQQSGFSDSSTASDARVKENKAALAVLGATIHDYGYLDDQYSLRVPLNSATKPSALELATSDELEQEIAKDIQALIASYQGKTVNVFGPALFKPGINHPDHELLHKAYVGVANSYPATTTHFYFYEDYPYVELYNQASLISLKKNIENESGFVLTPIEISLNPGDVSKKLEALRKYDSQIKTFTLVGRDIVGGLGDYTKNRCGENKPCEVVYEVFRAPSEDDK
jgi:LmbE family N-acetylglucosaminyl deacetylase